MTTDKIIKTVKSHSDKNFVKWVSPILQVTEGGYGENDKLLGVRTPILRKLAKEFSDISSDDIVTLLHNDYHEIRALALMIMIHRFRHNKSEQESIVNDYIENADYINNWDLVDISASNIIGNFVFDNKDKLNILYDLSKTEHLWKQRIAIVSTQYLIKKGFYEPTIKLSEKYLEHPHHLIHKAVGWMLRELGKKDINELYSFLDKYADIMPRVMLRYAIERFDKPTKDLYLRKKTLR